MKKRNVGILAAAAMTMTSLTVWSVTRPSAAAQPRAERAVATIAVAAEPPTITVDRFAAGDTLQLEGRLGHQTLVTGQDNETYLYLNVRASSEAVATKPAPVNLAVVIDRSGSMRGKRLQNAIDAARGMVERLRDGDVVSVITYNTTTQTLIGATTVDAASRHDVSNRISGITAAGDTCISCAIEAGLEALKTRDGLVKRILLLSDGEATAGLRTAADFERIAKRVREQGCSISSVGVDVDFNERIMTAVATGSNGRHYFVENAASLPAIFEQELQSLMATVATDGVMRITLAPGVRLLQVYDRFFNREGNELRLPMGLFSASQHKTVLVKVQVAEGQQGARAIADVELSFQDLVSGAVASCEGSLSAKLTSDAAAASTLDPLVGGRLGRSETAATLRAANRLFAKGDVAAARSALTAGRTVLAKRRAALAPKAAPKRKAELDFDFDRQLAALDDANRGFASPPATTRAKDKSAQAAAKPPNRTRAGRAQVRQNAFEAADMAH